MIRLLTKLPKAKLWKGCRMSTSCRVAVLQMTSTSDKERNRRKCEELLRKAKQYGAQAVFLPEAFDFIGESTKQTSELAEFLDEKNGTIGQVSH